MEDKRIKYKNGCKLNAKTLRLISNEHNWKHAVLWVPVFTTFQLQNFSLFYIKMFHFSKFATASHIKKRNLQKMTLLTVLIKSDCILFLLADLKPGLKTQRKMSSPPTIQPINH